MKIDDLPRWLAMRISLKHDCWEWMGFRNRQGYGHCQYRGRSHLVHRLVYTMTKGAIPQGLTLDHLCRNPSCVNPEHLEPVSQRENTLRGVVGQKMMATHCSHGHEYTEENSYYRKRGGRECRKCHTTIQSARHHRLHPEAGHINVLLSIRGREIGIKARHVRWHVNRGLVGPDCPMCGADPGAKSADEPLEHRFVGPGEMDDNSGGGHGADPVPF